MNRLFHRITWVLLICLLAVPVSTPFSPAVRAQSGGDWNRVKAAGKLVVGTSADYPPFAFYNDNFDLDGFDIALAQELGERLGVTVEFNDFAFAGLLDALQLGQVDAAIGAISVTPDRQQVVDFTNLYYVDEDAVLVRAGNDLTVRSATDFAGLRVGVVRGTTYGYWAQTNLVEGGVIAQEELTHYADTEALIAGLRRQEVDAVLLDRLTAFVYNMGSMDLRPAGRGLNQQRLAIALPKGSTLVDPLNDALLAIQADGTYAELVRQYLQVDRAQVSYDAAEVTVENEPAAVLKAAEAECINGMSYVADLNLDDYNMTAPPVMALGQAFVKSWRVRNSGTCTWEADYLLLYTSGNRVEAAMGAEPLRIGRSVAPGETIDLSISLNAPRTDGVFQAFYQMRDNSGRLFGEVIWVGIQVPSPNPPTPTPPPPAGGINLNLRADANWINSGQCTNIRWDVDNISAIYFIDGNNIQGVGGHDVRTVCPQTTTTYVLRIIRTDGSRVEFPITVNVTGQSSRPGPAIGRFRVNHNEIRIGECVKLEWRTDYADGVNLYRGGTRIVTSGPPAGSYTDCPPAGRHDYRLEAYGNGQGYQDVSVHVYSERVE